MDAFDETCVSLNVPDVTSDDYTYTDAHTHTHAHIRTQNAIWLSSDGRLTLYLSVSCVFYADRPHRTRPITQAKHKHGGPK
mmetsp:Transcript_16276/g.46341  ORF Transcript_16276/g.46341 Transcript_16276/m.46341 type:complete len:81 (-) Transcript_16276:497-739(-)